VLKELCVADDIIFCQEHWLIPDVLHRLNAVAFDFVCFNKSAMDEAISHGVLRGRSIGVLSVLVRNTIFNILVFSLT